MDDVTYSILEKMGLENVKLLSLMDFEDETMRRIKLERTVAEYCWTCTAPLIEYVMQKEPEASHIAYLDADLFFFNDPSSIYDELGSESTLIIPHRYSSDRLAWEKTSGIYNVSVVIFRNDTYGRECLSWWKERTLEECRLDAEAGKCGDQKYLDDWPVRFRNVVVLQNKGGGLAPWNITKYQLSRSKNQISVDADELIFYHFHSLQIIDRGLFRTRPFVAAQGYQFTRKQLILIYLPYVQALCRIISDVQHVSPGFDQGYIHLNWRGLLRNWRNGNLLLV